MNKSILYPGTFDPITNGHADLVERAANIFDTVIVAITTNPQKKTFFTQEERLHLAKKALKHIPNVEVCHFSGLLTEFAKQQKVPLVLRGLRAVSDFEFEFQLAGMNRKVYPKLETLFLTPSEQYTYISSTLVREIATLGGDTSQFVHVSITEAFRKKLS